MHHLVQSRWWRTTRFRPQPDRLIPQSQSFSRSYGSILPTSLTYIILLTRGCSPWRPAADMGTAQHENHTIALGFSRADKSTLDTARAAVLYDDNIPISGQTDFRESRILQRKDNSSQDFCRRLRVCLRYRTWLKEESISVSEFGNINPIPFRTTFHSIHLFIY